MDERQLLNNALDSVLKSEYESFDHLIFANYFDTIIDCDDLTRIKTDKYGDAGNDYIFFTYNRKIILGLEDLEGLEETEKGNRLDAYFIQIKNSSKLDSNVPNKFIEFSRNLLSGNTSEHYNNEVNYNISFFSNLVNKLVLKAKFYVHFYYFSRVGKNQVEHATDLNGRFNTLREMFNSDGADFIERVSITVENINGIIAVLRSDKSYEYTFDNIERFEAEVNKSTGKTAGVIALIPIQQLFNFISVDNGEQINDRLFESNIRDYKGRSNVNKSILSTLENKTDIDFWWLNNGITITAEEIEESKSAKKIKIVNPQIVNGLQTSYSIFYHFTKRREELSDDNRKVFVKILRVDQESDQQELEIIVATNSQNEIRDKDIHANDSVQKNIEEYFKQIGKYYQRKDKYYTNRKQGKKDIVKLSEMAKYINTIYLKDPSGTRNNPGKLLSGNKYKSIFQIENINQDYTRYSTAYFVYCQVMSHNKGVLRIGNDEFEKTNFRHHLVYVTVCNEFKTIDYTPDDLKRLEINNISEEKVNEAMNCIVETIERNEIPHTKVLKSIKEQTFTQLLNRFLKEKYQSI